MKSAGVGTIVLALAMASASAAAQVDSSWRDHERALQTARAANDTVRYRAPVIMRVRISR